MNTQRLVSASAMFLLLLLPLQAAAQDTGSEPGDPSGPGVTLAEVQRPPALNLSPWVEPTVSSETAVASRWQTPQPLARSNGQSTAPSDRRSAWRIILGAAVGGTAGLFAGGYVGARIEGDSCNCDDAGLMGALIGMPIGAAVGGILGGLFLF